MTLAACAALLERGDPDRFLAIMAAPVPARELLFPLFAMNLEVARAPWITEEPMIAEMRLQWWRDLIVEAEQRKPPRAHEVAAPVWPLLAGSAGPVLDRMIAARRWDIYREPFEDEEHFATYLDDTAGGLLWTAAEALGGREEATIRTIGRAAGLAAWLRAVPELEASGRVPLVDGRPEAVAALASEALASLPGLPRRFGAATPAVRTAWRARHILREAARDPRKVANGTLGGSEFRRRGGLMLRAAFGWW